MLLRTAIVATTTTAANTTPIAIIIIQEASKDLCSKKSLFVIPILQSASKVLLIFFFVTVASFLITSGSAEFRVVDACSSETCKNVDTGDMFALNDVCDQATFAECTGCPRAQCVHHEFYQVNQELF